MAATAGAAAPPPVQHDTIYEATGAESDRHSAASHLPDYGSGVPSEASDAALQGQSSYLPPLSPWTSEGGAGGPGHSRQRKRQRQRQRQRQRRHGSRGATRSRGESRGSGPGDRPGTRSRLPQSPTAAAAAEAGRRLRMPPRSLPVPPPKARERFAGRAQPVPQAALARRRGGPARQATTPLYGPGVNYVKPSRQFRPGPEVEAMSPSADHVEVKEAPDPGATRAAQAAASRRSRRGRAGGHGRRGRGRDRDRDKDREPSQPAPEGEEEGGEGSGEAEAPGKEAPSGSRGPSSPGADSMALGSGLQEESWWSSQRGTVVSTKSRAEDGRKLVAEEQRVKRLGFAPRKSYQQPVPLFTHAFREEMDRMRKCWESVPKRHYLKAQPYVMTTPASPDLGGRSPPQTLGRQQQSLVSDRTEGASSVPARFTVASAGASSLFKAAEAHRPGLSASFGGSNGARLAGTRAGAAAGAGAAGAAPGGGGGTNDSPGPAGTAPGPVRSLAAGIGVGTGEHYDDGLRPALDTGRHWRGGGGGSSTGGTTPGSRRSRSVRRQGSARSSLLGSPKASCRSVRSRRSFAGSSSAPHLGLGPDSPSRSRRAGEGGISTPSSAHTAPRLHAEAAGSPSRASHATLHEEPEGASFGPLEEGGAGSDDGRDSFLDAVVEGDAEGGASYDGPVTPNRTLPYYSEYRALRWRGKHKGGKGGPVGSPLRLAAGSPASTSSSFTDRSQPTPAPSEKMSPPGPRGQNFFCMQGQGKYATSTHSHASPSTAVEVYADRSRTVSGIGAAATVPAVLTGTGEVQADESFPSIRAMLNDPDHALTTIGTGGGPPMEPPPLRQQLAIRRRSNASNASESSVAYIPKPRKRVQLATYVSILSDPTPIRGTVYVCATMRLAGITAGVFREHLLLKIMAAFAEVLSLRVPSLADEDVDIVHIYNMGTGSAVGGGVRNKPDAVRAIAVGTAAKMNSKRAYAYKLALAAEEDEMDDEQREERKRLLKQASVQTLLFGPLEPENKMEMALEKERKRAASYKEGRKLKLLARQRRQRLRAAGGMQPRSRHPAARKLWPTANRVNKMADAEASLLRRSSVDKALEKVTSLMSALGGEESLLGHIFLTSDRHSIPVNYPVGFYKASNWEGRLLQRDPEATGHAQLAHAYSGIIAAHHARSQSHAALQFDVRSIVKESEAGLVQQIYEACMSDGYLDLIKLDALQRNPPPKPAASRAGSVVGDKRKRVRRKASDTSSHATGAGGAVSFQVRAGDCATSRPGTADTGGAATSTGVEFSPAGDGLGATWGPGGEQGPSRRSGSPGFKSTGGSTRRRRKQFTVSARLLAPTRSSARVHGQFYGQSQERGHPTCRRCAGAGCQHRSATNRHLLHLSAKAPVDRGAEAPGFDPEPDPLYLRVDPTKTTKNTVPDDESVASQASQASLVVAEATRTPSKPSSPSSRSNKLLDALTKKLFMGETPILHATASNLMRARLRMQHGLPLESEMLMAAVDELQDLAREAKYAKRHMEMTARHVVQEFYRAKAKLKDCKQEIRSFIYEVDEK